MELERALKRLLIKSPFYGLFCLSLPKRETKSIPTLAVAKKGINCELLVNPDFWVEHTDDEQIALLTHELSHIALQHMFIGESFPDQKTANLAMDMEVNSYIENLPSDAIKAHMIGLPDGKGSLEYYKALTNQQQQQSQPNNQNSSTNTSDGSDSNQKDNSSSGDGEANRSQGNGQNEDNKDTEDKDEPKGSQYPDDIPQNIKPIDDHSHFNDFKNIPEATQQLIQNNLNSILKNTAEQVEKMRGNIPANLVEKIEKLREKKPEIFNWKAYFRRMLGSIYDVNIKSTRRKQSKRFEGAAGIQHKKKVSILVAVDTSGSVATRELQEFFNEINYIYKAGARVTIVQCDTQINSITEYDGKTIPEIHGRGGTDFNEPVEYYIKHKRDYASLIYFTDGECSLPQKSPSGMVWVITSNGCHQDYPGKTIYIPPEQ